MGRGDPASPLSTQLNPLQIPETVGRRDPSERRAKHPGERRSKGGAGAGLGAAGGASGRVQHPQENCPHPHRLPAAARDPNCVWPQSPGFRGAWSRARLPPPPPRRECPQEQPVFSRLARRRQVKGGAVVLAPNSRPLGDPSAPFTSGPRFPSPPSPHLPFPAFRDPDA